MSYKVLVIEDNTDCRELFAVLIRYLGFAVIEAHDGEVGVQKALIEKPDLISEILAQNPDVLITMGAGDIGLEVPKIKNELTLSYKKQ